MNKSDNSQQAIDLHRELGGKLEVNPKRSAKTKEDLALLYSPGVGAASMEIAKDKTLLRELTGTNNSVAIISDGSAVLGLGDIGPEAALPVMEGKALLFKDFAGIDGYPVVVNESDPDKFIEICKAIAPSYGGINLEDISAPRCFEIEDALKEQLNIPVMHDDQHGTAVVVLAGVINALTLKHYVIDECRIVISGAGAAGIAIADILYKYGAKDIIMIDSKGAINSVRTDLHETKQRVAGYNASDIGGEMSDVLRGAHMFIGVSKAGILSGDMVRSMAKDPIIFALANPVPEIMPDEAKAAGALVVATGRSDFPNQVNNVLAFPGIFRGALDNQVSAITDQHKIAAAEVIAASVENLGADNIIPDPFTPGLADAIAVKIT